MADEAVEETGKKSSKLVMILIILVVVLIGAIGAGAAWFFLMKEDQPAQEQEATTEIKLKKEAIYVKIRTMGGKPYFITNFSAEKFGTQRFLQIFVEARTREPDVQEALQKHMPLVVHRLSALFSAQTLADMQTAEGKTRLRNEATDIVKNLLQEEIGKPGIEELFFTNFVMQ
ncbi:flagellar basal body-associated FliL family protein [Motiliproteus sp. MSK22-1]|uniref:flagellar basal body-associated FliL family protein n=1 Tax=Motiliproteus sp. MSK22-1 TaxID=1897630 RepID=UPI0009757237|nr:flagellar basal body-associated FliL family protein [Motiliproteus sp. MSK22-1]OMH30039.1 hypothetical protein BGP75_19100 [Motiliproteus sp. MSK22-1]